MKCVNKDIVVVGAGIAGICAAVAAARQGAKVALVHNRPVLGGNASTEIGVGINGGATYSASVYGRENGIVGELQNNIIHKAHYGTSKGLLDMVYFDFVYSEENIELFLNTNVTDVETDGDIVKSVKAIQINAENEFTFSAPVFIDCSGDGFVGYRAGAEFMSGREGKAEFGESLAPDESDAYLQGSTLFWHSVKMDKPVPYQRPAFAYDINQMPFKDNIGRKDLHRVLYGDGLNTLWWIEYGGQCDTIHDNEDITLELRKIVYGFWDYVKNSGNVKHTENYRLESVAPVVGKRESRRFKGDYILTQNDIFDKTEFPDAISTGGWVIDCHAPFGIYDENKASNWVPHRGLYSIPYRCLYSKNIKNLFFGGRIISTSHIAHGSTRVIATGAAAAHASGLAAYLCVKNSITPKEVNAEELQELLARDDQYILKRKERYNPELMDCTITASSEALYENTEFDSFMELVQKHYMALPSAVGKIDSVDIYVKNTSEQEAVLSYNVYTGKLVESFLPTILLHEKEVIVPGKFVGYITLSLDAENMPDKKAYIEFLKNENIQLGISGFELTGSPCFEENNDETAGIYIDGVGMKTAYDRNVCFKNVQPQQNMFCAEKLLDGYTRPYGIAHAWMSNGKNDEWVEIDFGKEKFVEEIQLIFNDDLKQDNPPVPQRTLLTDYVLDIDGETIHVSENIQRKNKFSIGKKVKKIRIQLLQNGGHPRFEMFGIRLY